MSSGMNNTNPFSFCTERRLVTLTGLRAVNLDQLLSHLRDVPGSSIFYHTHHLYLAHHFETPLFSNDFALWVSEALREQALGEKLAAIDLLSFTSIRQLREEIIAVIEGHLRTDGHQRRDCAAGDEFHFCRSKSFIMPTGLVASNPTEFFDLMPQVSNLSIFFHFFEARLRLGRPANDFSQWLADCGEAGIAAALDKIDPYSMTLDEFRDRIVALGKGEN